MHFTVYSAHASMHFTLCLPYACRYAFHCLLSLRMHLCTSLCACPTHASMHFTVYFPVHASMYFTLRLPYAFHCALSLCMSLCIALSTFPIQLSCAERLYRKNPSQCFREVQVETQHTHTHILQVGDREACDFPLALQGVSGWMWLVHL